MNIFLDLRICKQKKTLVYSSSLSSFLTTILLTHIDCIERPKWVIPSVNNLHILQIVEHDSAGKNRRLKFLQKQQQQQKTKTTTVLITTKYLETRENHLLATNILYIYSHTFIHMCIFKVYSYVSVTYTYTCTYKVPLTTHSKSCLNLTFWHATFFSCCIIAVTVTVGIVFMLVTVDVV